MNFSEALEEIKRGEKVTRKEWHDYTYLYINKNNVIFRDEAYKHDEDVKNIIDSKDLLADDWKIVIDMPKVGDIVKVRSKRYGIITNCHGERYDVMLGDGQCFEMDSYDFELIGRNKKNKLDIIFENINEAQKGQ